MNQNFIPFHQPSIGEEEREGVRRVLGSGWLTTGPVAKEFEGEFATYVGAKHALAVNSATSALQLALDAVGLRPDDEVLLPTYTFTATAEVVVHFGGRPVLCDSHPGGFNIDVADAERRITDRTRAIIPVHIAGEPCDLTAVHELSRRHGLHVIEDAAHALPASWNGGTIGSLSELTAFSFYANKTITTGEGGMLTTDDDSLAERCTRMRLHGISSDVWNRYSQQGSWYYEVVEAGYKLNMPDLLAAVGVAQLRKAQAFQTRREEIAKLYNQAFAPLEELEIPPQLDHRAGHAWHLYILRLRENWLSLSRNQFVEQLKALGIGSSVHFIPLHVHPYYQREYGYKMGDFPNAENAYRRCISLPIFPGMSDVQVERVIGAVMQIVISHRLHAMSVA